MSEPSERVPPQGTYDYPEGGLSQQPQSESERLRSDISRRDLAPTRRERDGYTPPATALALVGIGALAATAVGISVAKGRDRQRRPDDDAPLHTGIESRLGDYTLTGRSVTIAKPRSELYAFFRDFQNLPDVMENVTKITPSGPNERHVWTIAAPAGRTVDVETEVSEDVENERIAWRSTPGSDIDTNGTVTFSDAPGDRGTVVQLVIAYEPPLGAAGRAVAKLFGREPHVQARRDLKRLKMFMEAGELATSARRREDRDAGL